MLVEHLQHCLGQDLCRVKSFAVRIDRNREEVKAVTYNSGRRTSSHIRPASAIEAQIPSLWTHVLVFSTQTLFTLIAMTAITVCTPLDEHDACGRQAAY